MLVFLETFSFTELHVPVFLLKTATSLANLLNQLVDVASLVDDFSRPLAMLSLFSLILKPVLTCVVIGNPWCACNIATSRFLQQANRLRSRHRRWPLFDLVNGLLSLVLGRLRVRKILAFIIEQEFWGFTDGIKGPRPGSTSSNCSIKTS